MTIARSHGRDEDVERYSAAVRAATGSSSSGCTTASPMNTAAQQRSYSRRWRQSFSSWCSSGVSSPNSSDGRVKGPQHHHSDFRGFVNIETLLGGEDQWPDMVVEIQDGRDEQRPSGSAGRSRGGQLKKQMRR